MCLLKKSTLLICISLLFSACATNKGDFGLADVAAEPSADSNSGGSGSKPPVLQDEQTPPRTEEQVSAFMQPGLGAAVEIPRRSTGLARSPKESVVPVSADKIQAIGGGLEIPYTETIKQHPKFSVLLHSHDGYQGDHRRRDMKYVRSGWVADPTVGLDIVNGEFEGGATKKVLFGSIGHVYYKGINPSQAFPAGGKASYKGTWDFVTDAREGRDSGGFNGTASNVGDYYGAASFNDETVNTDKTLGEVGHSSEFEVDFANKTLSGNLYRNHSVTAGRPQERTHRYAVNASLKGNRFQGRVSAQNKNDAYFGKDGDLEGGFFGPAAEELAGKFLADDSSLFGVFAGKRSVAEGEKTEKAFDAYTIGFDKLNPAGADNFGDARKLVFEGKVFPLLPAAASSGKPFLETLKHDLGNGRTLSLVSCCSNLDYLKFGTLQTAGGGSQNTAFFFQGERTPESAVPTSGSAQYKGSWQAYILSSGGTFANESPNNKEGGSRAAFTVDFGGKTLKGTLTADDRALPSFTVEAALAGNGFAGTAKTGKDGFNLDPGGSGATVHLNAEVKGGFYGPNAAELGGVFHGGKPGEDQVGGSFGAKRQVETR